MHSVLNTVRRLVVDERGIQHVEEALLLALIGVAAILAAGNLGDAVGVLFDDARECLEGTDPNCA